MIKAQKTGRKRKKGRLKEGQRKDGSKRRIVQGKKERKKIK